MYYSIKNGIGTFLENPSSIEQRLFYKNNELIETTLPISVKNIEQEAFRQCHNLRRVVFLPDSKLLRIGKYAFQDSGIRILDLSNCLEFIEFAKDSFKECTDLEIVILPQKIKELANRCFLDCKNLKTVYYLGEEEPKQNGDSFKGCIKFEGFQKISKDDIPDILASFYMNEDEKNDDSVRDLDGFVETPSIRLNRYKKQIRSGTPISRKEIGKIIYKNGKIYLATGKKTKYIIPREEYLKAKKAILEALFNLQKKLKRNTEK